MTSVSVGRFFASLATGLVVAAPAFASPTTGTIYGTGLVAPGGTPGRDSHWNIVAGPTGFTPPDSQSYANGGYKAYAVPDGIPPNWLGGAWQAPPNNTGQNSYVENGVEYRWISASPTYWSLVGGTYSWIAAQQFYAAQSGAYYLSFSGAADERMYFYIDGTVNTSDPVNPTISGGQYIGWILGFGAISTLVTTQVIHLDQGWHTAYMVLQDTGYASGALLTTSSFTYIPAPGAIALLGAMGLTGSRRRR